MNDHILSFILMRRQKRSLRIEPFLIFRRRHVRRTRLFQTAVAPATPPSCSRGTRAASVGQMANRTPLMHSGSSHSPGETWTPSGRSFPPTVEPLSASERRERVAETEQPDSGELTFVSVSQLTPQVTSHDRTCWGHLRPNTR